ncbi:hypothetical protein [Selenomonas sp. oral taxon 136]|uniref:hypothetical protein n=1 Tax=Selenomonas sp. oral taxon 136 TaxID=713030 RepID=UPI000768445A|nr:hypothetical protein [Selenomonas sp. oral taxon 136]AME04277.1 hypothetical protein AXE86_09420 [Selenomonas sp. oral taxon 136]
MKRTASIDDLAPLAQQRQSASFQEMNEALRSTVGDVVKITEGSRACNYNIYDSTRKVNDARMKIGGLRLGFGPKEMIDFAKTDHSVWGMKIHQLI